MGNEKSAAPAGVPFEIVDLTRETPDVAAFYALFRRYLFDYRTALTLPLLFLIDGQGFVHKIYPDIPSAGVLRADFDRLNHPERLSFALPFAGKYHALPRRNHFRMGAAFYWAGYPEQSLLYFEEALRNDPDNARTQLAIGHIHLEAGRHANARVHLERAVALNPESGDAWNDLGGLEMALQNYREAVRCFDKALAILPNSAYALVTAGRAYAKLGDPLTATKFLLRAIAVKRDDTATINDLGVLYMEMQKPDDAIAAFRYGIEIAPTEEVSYVNLARVYVHRGDYAKAREVLKLLLIQKPDSDVGRKALRELDTR
jgi:tetratricopeptide (TPR) repeat protein